MNKAEVLNRYSEDRCNPALPVGGFGQVGYHRSEYALVNLCKMAPPKLIVLAGPADAHSDIELILLLKSLFPQTCLMLLCPPESANVANNLGQYGIDEVHLQPPPPLHTEVQAEWFATEPAPDPIVEIQPQEIKIADTPRPSLEETQQLTIFDLAESSKSKAATRNNKITPVLKLEPARQPQSASRMITCDRADFLENQRQQPVGKPPRSPLKIAGLLHKAYLHAANPGCGKRPASNMTQRLIHFLYRQRSLRAKA